MTGVSLYVTDDELEGLRWGLDHLFAIYEAAGTPPPELTKAIDALGKVSAKGYRAESQRARRGVVRKALKIAASE